MADTIIKVEASKWVDEKLLTVITGLGTKTIENYRLHSWIEGIHYKSASPQGKNGKNCKKVYNRIEIDAFFDNLKRVA